MVDIEFKEKEDKAVAVDDNKIIGECNFVEDDEKWNIVHTEVDNKYQGQGIARKLVELVLIEAKKRNKKVVAQCSYAKKIINSE